MAAEPTAAHQTWHHLRAIHRKLGKRTEIVIAVIVVAVLSLVTYAKINAGSGLSPLVRTRPERHGGTGLVVLVHGYMTTSGSLRGVGQAIRQVRPDLDLLYVDYPAQRFSNADPEDVAKALCEQIDDEVIKEGYTSVTLVGHSVGALIVRRAFVLGCSQSAPHNNVGAEAAAAAHWSRHVDRIVLLAGMNRGWSVDPAPEKMSFWKSTGISVGRQLARLTNTGKLIMSAEKGSPFVADLRVEWMRARREKQSIGKYPPVIQFLGTRDDVVSPEDSKDVAVSDDFAFVELQDTDHASIVDLGDPTLGSPRAEKLKLAFSKKRDEVVQRLRSLNPGVPQRRSGTNHVIFVTSGIRDLGHWTATFEAPIQREFLARHPDPTQKAPLVIHPSYGYFGMGPFLWFGDRQRNVRWFMDQYTQVIAENPEADPGAWDETTRGRIDFIGHSYGTYVLGSALNQYRSLKVNRVVLGGTVLPSAYDWRGKFEHGQVHEVKNYVGSADWVVAWFPRAFESGGDIGAAGFNGFQDIPGSGRQVTYVPGGHGAAFDPRNTDSIIRFVMNGVQDDGNYGYMTSSRAACVGWLSKLWPVVWAVIVLVVLGVGYLVARVGRRLTWDKGWPWYCGYSVCVLFLLYNI